MNAEKSFSWTGVRIYILQNLKNYISNKGMFTAQKRTFSLRQKSFHDSISRREGVIFALTTLLYVSPEKREIISGDLLKFPLLWFCLDLHR